MGQALYRKYRPRDFSDTVGQEAIIKTLNEAVKSGRISHAYLFAGPRGVGKTSIARILAHEINNLPYEQDNFHLDIIEIDAASNRRIDEIRDLREKVYITPASAKYKVYIIDEVHMLTKEAFNALLKTLEEPPAHCVFILATTEAHKLPETIVSRTQRFNFKPISKTAALKRLEKIAKEEKIKVSDEVLQLLVDFGEGSLRDVIGLLDQLNASGSQVSEKEVRELLGIPSTLAVEKLLESIKDGNSQAALHVLDSIKEQAASPANIAKALSQQLRQAILENKQTGKWTMKLLKELTNVASSSNPQEALELAILEAASRASDVKSVKLPAVVKAEIQTESIVEKTAAKQPKVLPLNKSVSFTLGRWSELLSSVKVDAPSLYTALRLAEPTITDGKLNLAFAFQLHQKKAQEARHLKLIGKTIEQMTGDNLEISCVVDKELVEKRRVQVPETGNSGLDVKTISNIFGSAEVLES